METDSPKEDLSLLLPILNQCRKIQEQAPNFQNRCTANGNTNGALAFTPFANRAQTTEEILLAYLAWFRRSPMPINPVERRKRQTENAQRLIMVTKDILFVGLFAPIEYLLVKSIKDLPEENKLRQSLGDNDTLGKVLGKCQKNGVQLPPQDNEILEFTIRLRNDSVHNFMHAKEDKVLTLDGRTYTMRKGKEIELPGLDLFSSLSVYLLEPVFNWFEGIRKLSNGGR